MSDYPISHIAGVPVFDEGCGSVILIVHPGFDDGTSWSKVAANLSQRFRVIRILRKQYRASEKAGSRISVGEEADEIVAVTEAVASKLMLVGHSSGAIVALEALLRAASGSISGAVIYEPPLVTDQRLGGKTLQDARAELASGKPGMAMQIFVRDIVTASPAMAWLARWLVTLVPKYRGRVAHQLDDVQAIEDLGNRLAAYAGISIPLVVLEGERTPRAILERSQALRRVLPNARQFVLRGQGHAAHLRAPDHVAAIIAGFAGEALD